MYKRVKPVWRYIFSVFPWKMRINIRRAPAARAPPPSMLLPQRAMSLVAAALLATSSPLLGLAAPGGPPPTPAELSRLSEGLARVDFLLDNWDRVTTVCQTEGSGGALEDRQVVRTQNQDRCKKTPLVVQRFIGASSTLDPLFRADKLMIRAQQLVGDDDQEDYTSAVDNYITKQQISSTMAYTSSWSGIENPNGSVEQVEENLMQAKMEVKNTRETLATVVDLLKIPRAPKFELKSAPSDLLPQ